MAINNTGFPFKFWCAKVLPLVYDDSLSYYEFLCKLNNVIQGIADHNIEQDEAIQKNADDIALEITNRESADNALYNYIDNAILDEKTARESADNVLTNAINDEKIARENADTNLGNRIDTNSTAINDSVENIMRRLGAMPYDENTLYYANHSFCLHNDVDDETDYNTVLKYGSLYRCVNDTTGAFNAADWQIISVLGYLEELWTSSYENYATEYDNTHTYNVGDIVRYEKHGIYRCVNQTTGTFDYNDWETVKFSWITGLIHNNELAIELIRNAIAVDYSIYWSSDTPILVKEGTLCWYFSTLYRAKVDNLVDENTAQPNVNSDWESVNVSEAILAGSGTTPVVNLDEIYDLIAYTYDETDSYVVGRVVKIDDNGTWKFYVCIRNTSGTFEPNDWTLIDLGGNDLTTLLGEIYQSKIQTTELARKVNTVKDSIAPEFEYDTQTPIQYPKFSLVWDGNALYYAVTDTDSTAYPSTSANWRNVDSLFEWVQAQIGDVNRYNEVRNNTLNSSIT